MRRLAYGIAALSAMKLSPSGRRLIVAGSAGRLGYGLVTVFAPRFVAGRWAAPSPGSVLNLRGFGGQHITIAAFTLVCARSDRLARPAALLNVGIEIGDAIVGGLEVHEHGTGDPVAMGALTLPLINLATWVTAVRRLDDPAGAAR